MTQQTTTTHINSITIVKTSYGKVWLTQDDDKIVLLDEEAKELASHIKETNTLTIQTATTYITTGKTTTTYINDLTIDEMQFGTTWITQGEDKIVLSNKEAKRLASHLEETNTMTYQTTTTHINDLSKEQEAPQDSVHDLIKDSTEIIGRIRYGDISEDGQDKLLRELQDNLWTVDTLRRNC